MPEPLKAIICSSITDVFFMGIFLVIAAFVVIIFIPHLPMRDRAAMMAEAAKKDPDGEALAGEAHV